MNNLQIEFYEFENEDIAKGVYKLFQTNYDSQIKSTLIPTRNTIAAMGNTDTYKAVGYNDENATIIRVGSTLLTTKYSSDIPDDDVDKLLEEINYKEHQK